MCHNISGIYALLFVGWTENQANKMYIKSLTPEKGKGWYRFDNGYKNAGLAIYLGQLSEQWTLHLPCIIPLGTRDDVQRLLTPRVLCSNGYTSFAILWYTDNTLTNPLLYVNSFYIRERHNMAFFIRLGFMESSLSVHFPYVVAHCRYSNLQRKSI